LLRIRKRKRDLSRNGVRRTVTRVSEETGEIREGEQKKASERRLGWNQNRCHRGGEFVTGKETKGWEHEIDQKKGGKAVGPTRVG